MLLIVILEFPGKTAQIAAMKLPRSRFLLEHAQDLSAATGRAREVAEALIAAGLRRSLVRPAPAMLDRRIASWRAFHRMKNLPSPFENPLIAETRGRQRKSANPITRAVLEQPLTSCDASHRGLRDRACLMLGWASGGRRRAEIVALNRGDIDSDEFAEKGRRRIRLLSTKTTGPALAPRLPLKGRAARAVMRWIAVARIEDGPLFRPVSHADRVLKRRLSADGLSQILRHRLVLAGYPAEFASPHGLRAGCLTQAALDHTPARRHAALAASQRRPGPELLCRCRHRREPGDGSVGVKAATPACRASGPSYLRCWLNPSPG